MIILVSRKNANWLRLLRLGDVTNVVSLSFAISEVDLTFDLDKLRQESSEYRT